MQTKLTKLFLSVISIMMFSIVSAQCDMPENTLPIDGSDIWYNASADIGGFQFNVDGTTVSSASGGDAGSERRRRPPGLFGGRRRNEGRRRNGGIVYLAR